jgi:DNA-binding transcriptional regulator YhcF (GntR family)
MSRTDRLNIRINNKSSIPKYEQLVNEIIRNIRTGKLQIDDQLPSINYLSSNIDISRDTVINAYNELKSRGLVAPRQGKGFYVSSTSIKNKLKIFLLFDVMNSYKEVLYRSFTRRLGADYQVDIFFHYYNQAVFEKLIKDNAGKYGFYVIMPHFNEDVSKYLKKIPADKILIIDKDIVDPGNIYPGIFQEFYKDIRKALNEAMPHLRKYSNIKFISNHHFQFIPDGMEKGFVSFCRERKLKFSVHQSIKSSKPKISEVFLVVSDQDLIDLLKICLAKNWKPGKDIGIISYDDTPLKEILSGGISVISTDFAAMGKKAASMIINGTRGKVENTCSFIHRKSL